MMDFSRSSKHIARKPHKCFLCVGEIAVGEKYERYSGKYDGEFFDQCFHESCISILDKFCRDQQDEEYQRDWVADWLYGLVCNDCKKKECCEENVFRCKNVLYKLIEKLEEERDAAIMDCSGYCSTCAFESDCAKHDMNDAAPVRWYYGDCEDWEWHGQKEE